MHYIGFVCNIVQGKILMLFSSLVCMKFGCIVGFLQVDTSQTMLKENGVQLKLTVVDTPGFGDAVDNSNW